MRCFRHALALLLCAIASVARADPQAAQEPDPGFMVQAQPHAARGFGADSARVDSQITLRIPDAQADAVYEYLVSKYVARDDVLSEQFPGNHLHGQKLSDESIFTDEYFDSPTLQLYANKNSVRHRTRVNTTNPEDRKSGRQLVQVKVTPPGQFTLRNELKYEVDDELHQPGTSVENHPLLRLISRKLQADFKQVFADAGIDPYSLRRIFTIVQKRRRGYLNWDDKNIFSFSVDQGSGGFLWATGSFSSVDLGLVEITYTEASEARRAEIWSVRDAIVSDLLAHFPALVQTTDSKYSIVLEQLKEQIPAVPLIIRSGLRPSELLLLGGVCLILAVFLAVALFRRSKHDRQRTAPRPEHFQVRSARAPDSTRQGVGLS